MPWPGSLSTSIFPPWASMICRDNERPRPVPPGLVVKKGSKSFSFASGAMPEPESRTRTVSCSPRRAAVISLYYFISSLSSY